MFKHEEGREFFTKPGQEITLPYDYDVYVARAGAGLSSQEALDGGKKYWCNMTVREVLSQDGG